MVIGIVGSVGPSSFTPNPLQAVVGNQIVWTNSDTVTHHIVLDNGTDVGEVGTGQSTAAVTLATQQVGFHCTIHPSMVGTIGPDAAPAPPPTPPDYMPPSYDYRYH